MADQFDSKNYPTKEPEILIAGNRIAWKRTDLGTDYPPANYTLTYSAKLQASPFTEISITATSSGSDYLIEISQSVSVTWTPGEYLWQAYITRTSDSERITPETRGRGVFTIRPDFATSTADPRSLVKQTLDALEAALPKLRIGVIKSVSISGKTVTYDEALTWREYLKTEYRKELQEEKYLTQGVTSRRVGVRNRR